MGREATELAVPQVMGLLPRLALGLPVFVLLGAIAAIYFFRPPGAIENALVLAGLSASVIAAAATAIAIYKLVRRHYERSWSSLTFVVLAALGAFPVCLLGWSLGYGAIYAVLPLTEKELRAIQTAEQFVVRNGYTVAGHPEHLPVLENDIMDRLARSAEDLKAMRKGTLQARALGARTAGSEVLVYFQSIPPTFGNAYPTVAVNEEQARMLHSERFASKYKRNER
jgi:hypothetical protein